jgi:hypothetical protein
MTVISNPASPGAPVQIVAESPIRAPLLGNIPWSNHAAHPAVTGPTGAEVRTIPQAIVDAAGGPTVRRDHGRQTRGL